jgi:enoyl-CoA hydratase/carnithine racemase
MDYSGYQCLRITLHQGIARVLLDNGPINLLDKPLFKELLRLTDQLAADDQVRVVVLASANAAYFIAHFDVGLIQRFPTGAPAPDAPLSPFHRMAEAWRTMPKATIAVVEGRAGGGGSEIALSCDMRFALRGGAVFNQPEVALGILPGGSGTVRLSRLLGRSRALEVVLGCDDVDADLAEDWGWVNRTLDADALWPHVDRLAARIASFPPHAVAAAKASVLRAEHGVVADLQAEAAGFQGTLTGPGTQAAMARFLASGGQTPAGEGRLGALCGDLHAPPGGATPAGGADPGSPG